MLVTNLRNVDEIKGIHDDSFPLPDINNPLYFSKRLVITNGDLIAAGLVKLTAEAIIIINKEAPLVSKVQAIQELIKVQSQDAKQVGLQESYAFIKRHKMQELLRKLGFVDLYGEIPMMINL